MHVYFVAAWFPSSVLPRHGNFVARHARLVARRHRVTVVTVQEDRNRAGGWELIDRKEDGYRLVQVVFARRTDFGPRVLWQRFRAWRRAFRAARRRYGKPDLLHGHVLLDGGILAGVYAKLWGLRYVITAHATVYYNRVPLPGIRGLLARWAAQGARVIMPVSADLGRAMRRNAALSGRYRTVSNSVNTEVYTYHPPPATAVFRLLHVSNFLEEAKNISGILNAFARLRDHHREGPNFHLHLAGDGDHEKLQTRIKTLGSQQITTSGPHTEREIADLMQQHHAFLLFSHYETQSVVLLEAQCCGRPSVVTSVGPLPTVLLGDRAGILVPPKDEKALIAALLHLRHHYSNYGGSDLAARAAARYGEEAVLTALIEEYSRALER